MVDTPIHTADHLLPLIYDGLICLACNRLARYGPREYLHPAELVHEAFLRVMRNKRASFEGGRHLFFLISRSMRDLLVEGIRRNETGKRGRGSINVELEAVEVAVEPLRTELFDLKRALRRLADENPACAQIVILSYFAGLTHPEIADALKLSRATVERRWSQARTWLQEELAGGN